MALKALLILQPWLLALLQISSAGASTVQRMTRVAFERRTTEPGIFILACMLTSSMTLLGNSL